MQANSHKAFYEKLKQLNDAYIVVFLDYHNRSELVNRKSTASIVSEAYGLLQIGSTEERNSTKEFFLAIFREFIEHFIERYFIQDLGKHNDQQAIRKLIDKWDNFKKFVFLYYTIFQYAHNHYESAYKSYESLGKINKLQKQDSVFPIAAVALSYFSTLVYNKYRGVIHREIRKNLAIERSESSKIGLLDKQDIKALLEIVHSCGLKQMGRIGSTRGINNQVQFEFFKVKNNDISKHFENEERNSENFMSNEILNSMISDTEEYYREYYQEKLSILSPVDDFSRVAEIIQIEEEKSDFYLFSVHQKNAYLKKIKECLILYELQNRLKKEFGLRHYLEQMDFEEGSHIKYLKLFVKTAFKYKKQALPIIQKIIQEYLFENGAKINEKINKRKQYIADILKVKKAINLAIEEAMEKDIRICIVRDKCFRKILDSIEASRNLAQYADVKIKQCIKLKLNEDDTYEKIKDVFLVLENLAATDSFLIYHQELLGKRLIDSLNEPKIDIQIIFLKKLSEKLGSVSVSPHMNMIKDIQLSQELTQKYHKKLAFCNFRWSCRILSQPYWPDSLNKVKLDVMLPQILRVHAETVSEMFHSEFEFRYLNWKTQKGYSLFEGNFRTGKFRFQSENIFMMLLFHISEGRNNQVLYGNLRQKIKMNKESDNDFLMKCLGVLVQNNLIIRDHHHQNKYSNFTEGQLLRINSEYKPKQNTKLNQIIMIKVSAQINKAMHMTTVEHGKILRQRQKIIQAVLVKLLKHSHSTGNNSVSFQQLYQGIMNHPHLGSFQFSQSVVKKRLEQLIHRGFCQRDQVDRKIYHYIA